MKTTRKSVGDLVLPRSGLVEVLGDHDAQHRSEPLVEMTPRTGLHTDLHARSPEQALIIETFGRHEPGLTFVELRERANERRLGRANDRPDVGGELVTGPDAKAGHRVNELRRERRIVVEGSLDDRETRGTALLASVTEGRLHQVLHREIDVGTGGDDHRVLATRLSEQAQRWLPRGEELGGLERSREDDRADAHVGHQVPSALVVTSGHHLKDLARHAGVPELARQFEGDRHRFGRGLQDDGVSRGEGREHATGRNGVGEVPRRHDENDAERGRRVVGDGV